MTSTCLRNLTVLFATLLSVDSQAADLNARDFFAAPPGTSLGVLYLPATRAGDFHGPADINARLPGANQRSRERGLGDPQVGGTLFFVNDPASRTYSGLLSLITVPVGEYHSQNPDVSPGANRWGATFVYNYTHGIGEKWVLEANLEAQLYGRNNDYFGSELKQAPLYRLQAFASYDFSAATSGALRLIHADGGALRLNNRSLDDTHKRYTQVGFEFGHWLDRQNQLMVSLSQNVAASNGYAGTEALLRLVHVF